MDANERTKKYIASRFCVGIEAYVKVLEIEVFQYCPEQDSIKVLDVGCGPGQWSLAAAKISPTIKVIGIDINEYSLNFARQYSDKNNIRNVNFYKMSYRELLSHFAPSSFDVILCNSVLMYVDQEKALSIFSQLLKNKGILFSMWNHHIGYYIRRLVSNLRHPDFWASAETIRVITIDAMKRYIFNRPTGDNFILYNYIKRLAQKYGIKIEKMALAPQLDYVESYLILPCIWNFKGVKVDKSY